MLYVVVCPYCGAQLLEILSDLKLTTELIKTEADKTASDQSIDDINYNSLDTGLTAVPKSSKEYKMVDTYLKNTHGKTHHSYSLEIEDLFVVDKSSLPFVDDKDVSPDTTMLLWYVHPHLYQRKVHRTHIKQTLSFYSFQHYLELKATLGVVLPILWNAISHNKSISF